MRSRSARSRDAWRRAWLALPIAMSCVIARTEVPTTATTVVVEGVLNRGNFNQVVLVERTLNGSTLINTTLPFDPQDPIASQGGIPVDGADVRIETPDSLTFRGVEQSAASSVSQHGAGVYQFPLRGTSLIPGGTYRLTVRTLQGEVLTASTTVPNNTGILTTIFTDTVNRATDTVHLTWPKLPGTRNYALRVDSPYGPFYLFTDSTAVRLPGDLRNVFAPDIPHVFFPGFLQTAQITAVDSNFYDYYRTENDPFTGSGLISRVSGGLGLFGSVAELSVGHLRITAPQTDSVEGTFVLIDPPVFILPNRFTVYVESRSVRSDVPDALSGNYAQPNGVDDALIGTRLGTALRFALLQNQNALDTADVFEGALHGDTIVGRTVSHAAVLHYLKQP